MASKHILSLVCALGLCIPAAMAEGAPPPAGMPGAGAPSGAGPMGPGKMPSKEDMAKMQARMCSDGYAHAVGAMAELEVKLALTDKQKPAFERWKAVRLKAAKARAADCAGHEMPMPPPEGMAGASKPKAPSAAAGMEKEIEMLKTRLTELKDELPALKALEAVLTDEQKAALPKPGPHGPMMDGLGPDRHGSDRGPDHGQGLGPDRRFGAPPPAGK